MSQFTKKIMRVILIYIYYSLKVLGLSSVTINFSTLEVTVSYSSIAYCVFSNLLIIGIIPFISLSSDKVEYINQRILAMVILFINSYATLLTIIATVFLNLIYRHQVASLLSTYIKLVNHVTILTTQDFYDMHFLRLVVFKIWCPYSNLLCSVCVMFMLKMQKMSNFVPSVIFSGILLQMVVSAINLFYIALLYLWRMNKLLDEQLSKTLIVLHCNKEPSMQRCCDISDAIDNIAILKSNLYNLCVEVQGVFRFQKLISMVNYFLEVISKWFLFYSLMITVDQKNAFLVSVIFYGLFFLLFEVFLLIYASDLVIRIPTAEQDNLNRKYLQIQAADERLERSCQRIISIFLLCWASGIRVIYRF
ncbi:putative gustatory receptor 36a isoform X3 [Hermetia illucens]|uniref:putative gustatory receptor 36a isoform X3 n=1 Tax=Hermetia illucens TaxID=343691 RepID=UPI0018CC4DF8|nr:putative gustatory receptor 36a isoform X3 [Hermetia illucens]